MAKKSMTSNDIFSSLQETQIFEWYMQSHVRTKGQVLLGFSCI